MHTEERIAWLEGETGHLAMKAGIEAVRGEIENCLQSSLRVYPRVCGGTWRGAAAWRRQD